MIKDTEEKKQEETVISHDYFVVKAAFDLNDNASFDLVDENFSTHATCVIAQRNITVYFPDGKTKNFFENADMLVKYAVDNNYRFKKIRNYWKQFQPNPFEVTTGDCTIRAYCKAFDLEWEEAYDRASDYAKKHGYILDDSKIVEKIITEEFDCKIDPDYNKKTVKVKDRITVKQFATTHPFGTYLLKVPSHLVCVHDGRYYDSWDSGDKKVATVYLKID